jgi:adenylate cyclase
MAEVFLSYARPNELQAKQVADALRAEGYGVWRDDELPAHRAYADVIQERLKSARPWWCSGPPKPPGRNG